MRWQLADVARGFHPAGVLVFSGSYLSRRKAGVLESKLDGERLVVAAISMIHRSWGPSYPKLRAWPVPEHVKQETVRIDSIEA